MLPPDARTSMIRFTLHALDASGAALALRPWAQGQGIIFTLHHVLPQTDAAFAPNRLLAITPDFLRRAIAAIRDAGFEIVPLDDAIARLTAGGGERPFAALTFDDGFRDVRDNGLPVLREMGAPATLFIASAFAEGRGFLWWRALEAGIASLDEVTLDLGNGPEHIPLRSTAEKNAASHRIYWFLRHGREKHLRAVIADLAARAGYDPEADCRAACMDWEELRVLRDEPLISFGAHTVHHYMLAKWPEETVREEMARNRDDIVRELGVTPRHIAYPVGDPGSADEREFRIARELGFEAGLTTRPDHLRAHHAGNLLALPRMSLNGLYQDERYLRPLISGTPFALRNAVRKLKG